MTAKSKKLTYNPLDLLVSDEAGAPEGPVTEVDPAQVLPNPHQPRTYYDPAEQAELEASIRESGVHQPLLVRRLEDGGYQLVAGSRRLAAARAARLPAVPVVVRDYTDAEAEQVALVENLQRANLRFDDEAQALLRLKRRFSLTNEVIGRSIGKSTDYVELRIAAAEHPQVLDLYLAGQIEQKQIRAAIRQLKETGTVPASTLLPASPVFADPNRSDDEAGEWEVADPNGSDRIGGAMGGAHPNRSDAPLRPVASARPGRRPPDGWRWAGDVERRLQQLPTRAPRMDADERARAREYLLRLREATDRALGMLNE
jgi:ParB/RepB/Spo0J family partition protein